MSRDKEINRRLLDPEFHGSLDEMTPETPVALARRMVAKSKRRLLLLTIATCLTWIAATTAGVVLAGYYFDGIKNNMSLNEYRYASAHVKLEELRAGQRDNSYKVDDYLDEKQSGELKSSIRAIHLTNERMMVLTQATMILTGLAALLSVWLITASRRCTMKQVNTNLASLCEQLREMSELPEPTIG